MSWIGHSFVSNLQFTTHQGQPTRPQHGDAGQPNITSDVAAAAGLTEEPVSKARQSQGGKKGPESNVKTWT